MNTNKKNLIILIFTTLVISCAKKNTPVITGRKNEPTQSVVTRYPPPGVVTPDTATGRLVFINRCGRCHGLPGLSLYTEKKWDTILATMAPRARLKNDQRIHIQAYINANAAK